MRDRERERQRHRQRERQAPCREPDVGPDLGTSRSGPELKADAQLLSHSDIPELVLSIPKPSLTIPFLQSSASQARLPSIIWGIFQKCDFWAIFNYIRSLVGESRHQYFLKGC